MKHIIAITNNSTWLVGVDDLSAYVAGRLTFGGDYMPGGVRYVGAVAGGPDGVNIRVGGRLVFWCEDIGDYVTSGVINRIVNVADEPVPEPVRTGVDGVQFITLQPSWSWLLPFVATPGHEDARRAFQLADDLATLVDMGRVTQEDLRAARERRARA